MSAAEIDTELLPILQHVRDPELPQVSIVGLGIIRKATVLKGGGVKVVVTPTYSGCPALDIMKQDLRRVLGDRGYSPVEISLQYDPPWSSDWIDESSRELLSQGGVVPPVPSQEALVAIGKRSTSCPFCGSRDTVLKSEFGSTACKAMHYCQGCQQPFESFKSTIS